MRQRPGLPHPGLLLLAALAGLLGLAGCGGMEDGLRDLNRSLYRGIGGAERAGPNRSGGIATTACFNAESGLLYLSQTGRCAPGYVDIPASEAEKQFARRDGEPVQEKSPEPAPGIQPPDSLRQAGQALCYDDSRQLIFGADFCPPGSRWIDTPEAEALQRAALEKAVWCYYPSRRLLYRSRACRPGDQVLNVADADRLWAQLPADRKPRQRPDGAAASGGNQPPLAPVPQVQASPRGAVDAAPLPAPGAK